MKILLIKPYWPYPYSKGEHTYNRFWPPLCLANCAAVLEREGHEAKILDLHALRIKPDKVADYAKDYEKIFITSSSLDKWQCPNIDISYFLETVRQIKKITEDVYITGYHGTINPDEILKSTGAKAVIRGEPENTVSEICRNEDLSMIKGVSFFNKGEIVSNSQACPLDLKTLPVPAFHLLDFGRYFYEILGNRFCLFETNRGCYFKCKFCNKVMYGGGVRSKSKEQIFNEITVAIEKYEVKTGYFIDLDFLSDKEIAGQVCDYIINKKYKFNWACQVRADLIEKDILKRMKTAGCSIVHLGIETVLQGSLEYLNKNTTVEKAQKALKLCRESGIKSFAFFLFGLPNETDKDRKNMVNIIKRLNPDFVSFHNIVAYEGSDIYCERFKLNSSIDKFIGSAFISYYLRLSYLRNVDLSVMLKSLRLFYGRIRSL